MIVKIVRPINLGEDSYRPGQVVDTQSWRPNAVRHFLENGRIEPHTTNPAEAAAIAAVTRKEAT